MNAFFFGPSSQYLYGVFHPPITNPAKKEGILLCPPFGQEYMRSHRAYRQLAMLLTKKGFPVLRFDYRGTGNSSHDLTNIFPEDWLHDIMVAAEELKHMSLASNISLVGLRLGGLLAAQAIKEHHIEVERLVLWDPVVSGTDYDKELIQTLGTIGPSPTNCIDSCETLHFNGFPLSKKFREQISYYCLRNGIPDVRRVLQAIAKQTEASTTLHKLWQNDERYQFRLAKSPGNWNFVDEFGGILLPQPVIQTIIDWFSNGK